MPKLDGRKFPSATSVCLGLALLILLCYWPVTRNGFITFDDPQYLLKNRHVTSGFTWQGVAWAFRTGYASNWHPVTWVSHMLDCQLYGLAPWGHHLTNLLLHTAVTLLLFLFLSRLTGALWRSALVAALFAWHPLHVESVAWASERKDVLSAFFFLLTLLAYAEYSGVRSQESEARIGKSNAQKRWYALALLFLILGLM